MAIALPCVSDCSFQANQANQVNKQTANGLFTRGVDDYRSNGHSQVDNDTPPSLQYEAFPGELALLRQQNNQNNQLIDVMPTGLVILDGNGIVIKVNKMASQLLDEPILGHAWYDVIKRSFEPRADDWHEVSLKGGRRVKLEISALGDQPGQLIMITDLTQTRLLQDKLGQMQRLSSLGHMVSTLAHQIRTPLSSAMLYSANLNNYNLDEASRKNFQEKLFLRLKDLEQQVNDMLLFSKSGKEQVVAELSVNHLVNDAVTNMEAIIAKAKALVRVKICQDDCQILGNKNALEGAIQNLIHNSLQVIKEQAEINIQVKCYDSFAYISVEDNGIGIPDELTEKVFEPFYTSKMQGTGLGLSVVKSVVEAHQGQVKLLKNLGTGAHFCLKLPLFKLGDDDSSRSNDKIGEPENNPSLDIIQESYP
jgi:two-component system sensor histidine kinase FlrB|tara:strand:+ start:1409 stop:2674 length:1266 start_codon:yes stop_codon:yes gene_type:complete